MSLLNEIISEATGKSKDIPRLLRLCLVLAYKLKHDPLQIWVRHELEGYPEPSPVPDYRLYQCRNQGYFTGGVVEGILDLPTSLLPEKIRPAYETIVLRGSISEYADLVKNCKNGEALEVPWPPQLALNYASKHVVRGQCVRAWKLLSPSYLVAIIDRVTTKILNFALEIEAEAPNAGEIESTSQSAMKEERVTQIFNTTIQGNVQNYSAGGSHFQQTAVNSVLKGDLESLMGFLKTTGLADADLEQLQAALKTDQDMTPTSTSMGASVAGWVDNMIIKARQGLIGVGVDVVSGVITQAVLNFLGTAA